MNKLLIWTTAIGFTLISFFSYAQNEKATKVYTENVAVHINTSFLITGETLYYSIHCLEDGNRPSTLSKLAYVELIGENEKPFLQTKISLIEGQGAGDFFLPSTLPSGNYTLIAYTKWMRNFPVENFFQQQITIINPYLKSVTSETPGKVDKLIVSARSSNQNIRKQTNQMQIVSDKKKYSPRQKVVVVIKNNDPIHDCKVSLNVHRYDKNLETISTVTKSDSLNSRQTELSESQTKKTFVTFLPDLRGETIGGIVKERDSYQPVANTTIYLSAFGPSYFFQISRTDSIGRFYFSTKNIQTQTGIQFQVDRLPESSPVEVFLDDEFINDYRKFKPLPLSIDTTLRTQIEQRNVYSQIENAYFIKKRDSILDSTQKPFFGTPDKVYKLDEFTRFPTMEDVFREYMFWVVVSKRGGKFTLQLINSRNGSRFLNTPLILIDGILVFDTQILMDYNPLLIKEISLITRKYVYAGFLFDGVMSINTYDGMAKNLSISSIHKEYTSWQHSKKYYSPNYTTHKSLDRIPDYRVQLFWNPTITIEPGQEFVGEFYTSDIDGDFLIEAKGLNSAGEVVNIRDIIEVRK